MNFILGKTKFHSLKILLHSIVISSIVIGKHTKNMCKKKTTPFRCKTQGGKFQTKHQSDVEILLPELDATKIIICNFRVDESQGNHKYNMIMGHDMLSES